MQGYLDTHVVEHSTEFISEFILITNSNEPLLTSIRIVWLSFNVDYNFTEMKHFIGDKIKALLGTWGIVATVATFVQSLFKDPTAPVAVGFTSLSGRIVNLQQIH